jgi:hypothetical protein
MSNTKKNRAREQVNVELITDPELGKVVTLSDGMPRPMRTPLPYETRPTAQFDTDELSDLARSISETSEGRKGHDTKELSSAQIAEEVARASAIDTGALHRVDDPKHELDTVEWAQDDIIAMVHDAEKHNAPKEHPTAHFSDHISDLELGVMLDNEKLEPTMEDVPCEGETVRWDRSELPKIVSEAEASALLEVSSAQEDDINDTQATIQHSKDELDDLMTQASNQRPQHGQGIHTKQVTSPPRIDLLEERNVSHITRRPDASYGSAPVSSYVSTTGETDKESNARTLHVLGVLVIVFLIANLIVTVLK